MRSAVDRDGPPCINSNALAGRGGKPMPGCQSYRLVNLKTTYQFAKTPDKVGYLNMTTSLQLAAPQ